MATAATAPRSAAALFSTLATAASASLPVLLLEALVHCDIYDFTPILALPAVSVRGTKDFRHKARPQMWMLCNMLWTAAVYVFHIVSVFLRLDIDYFLLYLVI